MDVKELMTLNGILIRGDIHTQVATPNINMTSGGLEGIRVVDLNARIGEKWFIFFLF